MSHRSDNKYLHCTRCVQEKKQKGLTVFVTPTGDFGLQCVTHPDFCAVVPNEEVAQHFMDIAMQSCDNPECECSREEVTH